MPMHNVQNPVAPNAVSVDGTRIVRRDIHACRGKNNNTNNGINIRGMLLETAGDNGGRVANTIEGRT